MKSVCISREDIRTPEIVDFIFEQCLLNNSVYIFLKLNESTAGMDESLWLRAMNNYSW